jgi:hypothetical protein
VLWPVGYADAPRALMWIADRDLQAAATTAASWSPLGSW